MIANALDYGNKVLNKASNYQNFEITIFSLFYISVDIISQYL